MRLKKLLIIISAFLFVITIASCNNEEAYPTIECNHNIVEEYYCDANYHFKSCACGAKVEDKKEHTFINNVCTECGLYYNEALFKVFGRESIIYRTNNNPYGVDIEALGNDINVIFYEPKVDKVKDSYVNVDKDSFYKNYKYSSTYEDSYYRSKHGLLSGENVEPNHLPNEHTLYNDSTAIRITTATYILSPSGEYIGYFTNDLNNNSTPIWYCGAYVSLDEVSAYLLAFGCVPVNSNYDKNNGREKSIATWGKYGRVNIDAFSGNVDRYPYEPVLPLISGMYPGGTKYTETDFGTYDVYVNGEYTQGKYNNGISINRGAGRLVFVSDSRRTKIDERYVFYTYNHYNDFQEYLNYNGGYGYRFGNESAGNPYCGSKSDYLAGYNTPTSRRDTYNISIQDILSK